MSDPEEFKMNPDLETEVLVFSTSLRDDRDVEVVSEILNNLSGIHNWNVDLEDWEKVLRIECTGYDSEQVSKLLRKQGVYTRELSV